MSKSTSVKPGITGIDIHTYFVKDVARAVAFWRDTMGLPLQKLFENLGAEFELPDGSWFGLWRLTEEDGGWRPGGGIMFAVPEIQEAVAYYRSKGVKIEKHIEDTSVCFMAFAKDSEGNDFILHQRKE